MKIKINKEKKICTKCKKELARENHRWCLSCYRAYKKNWDNKDKGYYLYVILDKNNRVLYVGSTEHLKNRLGMHLSCNSNIKELMKTDKWDKIKYLDITNLVNNREELNYLENSLIELYDTEYNNQLNIIKHMNKLREFCLISELHSLTKKWSLYITREDYKTKKKLIYANR
jgi:hypothetical protein